jgi:cytochrome c oxidase cbb3-type subunit 3
MANKIEKDEVTGVETTGHVWDGLKELNNPLPRWWLYVFYATVIFSIIYMVIYPSIPLGTDYWRGTSNHSDRVNVMEDIAEADAAKGTFLTRIKEAELSEIRQDQDLVTFAVAGGAAAFAENCAPCHGTGAAGGPGYPNLQDDDWLWGGDLESIHTTLLHGIRWEQNLDTRFSEMPAFGAEELLSGEEIEAVAHFVLSLSGAEHDAAMATAGAEVYEVECAACHMDNGEGIQDLGAPALNDALWLYGGSLEEVIAQIQRPRLGVMPAWENRLNPETIKMLTVYVHELGGGQ